MRATVDPFARYEIFQVWCTVINEKEHYRLAIDSRHGDSLPDRAHQEFLGFGALLFRRSAHACNCPAGALPATKLTRSTLQIGASPQAC